MELLFLQMELFVLWIGAGTYIIVLDFWREIPVGDKFLSELLRFSRSWSNMKNGWAIFNVFSRSGPKYEKTVGLTLDSFSRPGSNMKREVEFIFRFRTLD